MNDCRTFCKAQFAKAHCVQEKCAACSFCRPRASAPLAGSADAASGSSGAPLVSLVVPTYPKHFAPATNFVKSVAKFVRNTQMLFVVTTDVERASFAAVLANASTPTVSLPNRANVTIRTLWEACQCGSQAGGDAEFLAEHEQQLKMGATGLMDKFVLQSSKKMMGALCTRARYVLMSDSESLFVRDVDLAEEVRRLATWQRRIVYDAPSSKRSDSPSRGAWRNLGGEVRSSALRTVEQYLNVSTRGRYYGFSFGYFWLFPTEIIRGFVELCRVRHGSYWRSLLPMASSDNPVLDLAPGWDTTQRIWFGELALFTYMLHVHENAADYEPVDAQALLRTYVPPLAGTLTEHLHCCIERKHHDGLARMYRSLNGSWPVWMADSDNGRVEGTLGLLRSSHDIYLLTSQQPEAVVQYAIGSSDDWAEEPRASGAHPKLQLGVGLPQPALCPMAKEPDVAILVGGIERGFLQTPRLWLSLKRNVLDQFAPRTYELLLFLKTFEWEVPESWRPLQPKGSDGQPAPAMPSNGAAQALQVLRPAAVEFATSSEVDELEQQLLACGKRSNNGTRPMLGYFFTLQSLWRLVTKRENERNRRYEVVMFARPDLIHYLGCGAHCLYDARRTVYHSIGADCAFTVFASDALCPRFSGIDFWWLGPRRYAEHLAGSLRRMLECRHAYNNEEVLTSALQQARKELGLQVEAHDASFLGASVVWRSGGRPKGGIQGIGRLAALNRSQRGLPELVYGSFD